MDETGPVLPAPASLAMWTEKQGYLAWRELIRVYLSASRWPGPTPGADPAFGPDTGATSSWPPLLRHPEEIAIVGERRGSNCPE